MLRLYLLTIWCYFQIRWRRQRSNHSHRLASVRRVRSKGIRTEFFHIYDSTNNNIFHTQTTPQFCSFLTLFVFLQPEWVNWSCAVWSGISQWKQRAFEGLNAVWNQVKIRTLSDHQDESEWVSEGKSDRCLILGHFPIFHFTSCLFFLFSWRRRKGWLCVQKYNMAFFLIQVTNGGCKDG